MRATWAFGYWRVTEGERWWSAHYSERQGWLIMNEHMRIVKPHSRLGRRVIHTVETKVEGQG